MSLLLLWAAETICFLKKRDTFLPYFFAANLALHLFLALQFTLTPGQIFLDFSE